MSLKDFRKNIIIELFNEAGQKIIAYNVYRCWVSEFIAMPELDGMGEAVAIQSIPLDNEGVRTFAPAFSILAACPQCEESVEFTLDARDLCPVDPESFVEQAYQLNKSGGRGDSVSPPQQSGSCRPRYSAKFPTIGCLHLTSAQRRGRNVLLRVFYGHGTMAQLLFLSGK